MSESMQKAKEYAIQGCNCAQAVALVFCERYGISQEDMLRLCNSLGCGMGAQGEMCGTATAGALIIGLKHGSTEVGDKDAKERCRKLTAQFLQDFKALQGALRCRDILLIDVSTSEGRKSAKPLFESKCRDIVQQTVRMLEDAGY